MIIIGQVVASLLTVLGTKRCWCQEESRSELPFFGMTGPLPTDKHLFQVNVCFAN